MNLTYRFELYADQGLTNLTSMVDGLASGGQPYVYWTINQDLAEDATYWWRALADEGVVQGEYSTVFGFTIDTIADEPPPDDPDSGTPTTEPTDVSPGLADANAEGGGGSSSGGGCSISPRGGADWQAWLPLWAAIIAPALFGARRRQKQARR